jgi:hypothetical protein
MTAPVSFEEQIEACERAANEWLDKRKGWGRAKYEKSYDAMVTAASTLRKVKSLYAAIEHGDEKHRAWLKQKIMEHFDDRD